MPSERRLLVVSYTLGLPQKEQMLLARLGYRLSNVQKTDQF